MTTDQSKENLMQLVEEMDDHDLLLFIREALTRRVFASTPSGALKLLFQLDADIYELEGQMSCAYDNGIHTKHRHTRYHDFFVNRIGAGDRVLDVGCGIGALAFDIAEKSGAVVTGIDINEKNIAIAKDRFMHANTRFFLGDVVETNFQEKFDVVVLSNVLEHIEDRVSFLKKILHSVAPSRVLLRVPLFERDWRVPLKKELGLDYRLDSTHFIEYTHQEFVTEIESAGLGFSHYESCWGEIWAEAKPS